MDVVKLRRANKISIGLVKIKVRESCRAHANFCRIRTIKYNAVIGFLLSQFINFFRNLSIVLLIFGRVCHSKAISELMKMTEEKE